MSAGSAAIQLAEKLRQADPLAHRDCINQLERLTLSTQQLRAAIDKQTRENQALNARIQISNNDVNSNVRQLGRTNPEVERLKLENYRLQKQLEQDYVQPDIFFKLETRPRKFEEDKRKDDQIRLLRKQLEIVRTECLKVGERGTNFLDSQRYERLQRQNQQLREFVKNRVGKRPSDIPPAIQSIVGVGPEVNNRQSIELPQVALLARTNDELQQKVDQLRQEEKLLLYQIQLREASYQQARELNQQLREQYAAMSGSLTNPPTYDPLNDRIQRLELECQRLRTILQQQNVIEGEIGQRMKMNAQAYELNQQIAGMQAQEAAFRRQAEMERFMPPAQLMPAVVQQTIQQQTIQQPMQPPQPPPQPPPQVVNRLQALVNGSYQPQEPIVQQVVQHTVVQEVPPAFPNGPPLLVHEIEQQRLQLQQQQANQQAEQARRAQQFANQQQQEALLNQQRIAQQQPQVVQQEVVQQVWRPRPPPGPPVPPPQMVEVREQTGIINVPQRPLAVSQQYIEPLPRQPQPPSHIHTQIQPGSGPIVINLGSLNQPPVSQPAQPTQIIRPVNPGPELIHQRTIIQTESHERRIVQEVPIPPPVAPQPQPQPPPLPAGTAVQPGVAPPRNFNIHSMFDD